MNRASGGGFSRFLFLAGGEGESHVSRRTLAHNFAPEGESMAGPSKDLVELEGTLRTLIEHLIDAQEGLQTVAEKLPEGTLKRILLTQSLRRAEFRGDLEEILRQEGVRDLEESGSPEGAFVRIWTELKARLGASRDALITAAAESEESTLQAYNDALRKMLPLPVREVLADQAEEVRVTHDALTLTHKRAA